MTAIERDQTAHAQGQSIWVEVGQVCVCILASISEWDFLFLNSLMAILSHAFPHPSLDGAAELDMFS